MRKDKPTKKLFVGLAVFLVVLVSWPQVKIISFDRSGTLAWTNSLGPGQGGAFPDTRPIYRIEWASSPTGPWNALTNTSETSIPLTNSQPSDQMQTLYRVAWTNGQVWNYQGYAGQSLIVTGRLYFNISDLFAVPVIDDGSWSLTNAGPVGTGWHRLGAGPLDSC